MGKSKRKTKQERQPDSKAQEKEIEIPVGDGDDREAKDMAEEESARGAAESEAAPSPETESLEEKVKRLEDQKLRAIAEMDNYRKRMARQFEDVVRGANDRLLGEVLDIADNFERALKHTENNSAENEVASFREGVELISNQMSDLLTRYDVRPIEAVGCPFDPTLHEALMQSPSDEYEEGTVISEVGKGYTIGGRVLRHSKVVVSRGKAEEEKSDSEISD